MRSRKPLLAVSELFGPTFQGEGASLGMPCMFLRLAGCNLACTWCDTRYTWDWQQYDPKQEIVPMTVSQVLLQLSTVTVRNLVISGGEPMLQQKNLYHLCRTLRSWGWRIEIETAGTRAPLYNLAHQYNVSPKLDNSANPLHKRYHPAVLTEFARQYNSYFKFVVTAESDFAEIDEICRTCSIPSERVYIMPEGITAEALHQHAQHIADLALERHYNLTTRLQILLYGNRRGR